MEGFFFQTLQTTVSLSTVTYWCAKWNCAEIITKKEKKNQQVDAFYRTQRSGNSGIFHLCKGFLFLLAAA